MVLFGETLGVWKDDCRVTCLMDQPIQHPEFRYIIFQVYNFETFLWPSDFAVGDRTPGIDLCSHMLDLDKTCIE